MATSKKVDYCLEHAGVEMAGVEHCSSGKKGFPGPGISDRHNVNEVHFWQRRATTLDTTAVRDVAEPNIRAATSGRSPTEDGGGSVAGMRGVKRKRVAFSGPASSAIVGTRRSDCPSSRRDGAILPLLPTRMPSGSDGEVSSEPRAVAGIKVEAGVPLLAHCGIWARECEELAFTSRGTGGICDDSSPSSSSSGAGMRWPYESLAVASGHRGVFDGVQGEEAENSDVKVELGVSGLPVETSDG